MKEKFFYTKKRLFNALCIFIVVILLIQSFAFVFANTDEEENDFSAIKKILFSDVEKLDILIEKAKDGKVIKFFGGTGNPIQESVQDPDNIKEGLTIDDLLDSTGGLINNFGNHYETMDEFLDNQPGTLKDYSDFHRGDYKSSIWLINHSEFDPAIMLVLLELKANAITSSNLKKEDLDNIFNFTESEIDDFIIDYYNIAPPVTRPSKREVEFTMNDVNKYHKKDYSLFLRQMTHIGRRYDFIMRGFDVTSDVILKDQNKITISEEISKKAYAIRKILAELADSKEQYEHWLSFDKGSFFDLYSQWFGFPMRLFEDIPPQIHDPPVVDLLSRIVLFYLFFKSAIFFF